MLGREDPFQQQTTPWYEVVNNMFAKKYEEGVISYPPKDLSYIGIQFHFKYGNRSYT
jgi:hypothetical protein